MIAAHLTLRDADAQKITVVEALPEGIVIDVPFLRGAHWFHVRMTLQLDAATDLADKLLAACDAVAIGAARSGSGLMNFARLNTLPDEHGPLIYVWRVGLDIYVGKSINGVGRAEREYRNNVAKMLAKEPYRKSKPDAWRRVHRRLHEAVLAGETITLELIPSTHETLRADKQRLICELGATLNGGG